MKSGSPIKRLLSLFLISTALWTQICSAERVLKASSLVTCMDDSLFSATNFEVSFSPDNRSIAYDVSANVEISGKVKAEVEVYAYGFKIIAETIDPCDKSINLKQLCPLNPGQIDIASHSELSQSIVDSIPGVAYTVPDIDAQVFVRIKDKNGEMQACIQAELTNTKSVDQTAVKWVTAVIAGLGLLTSAIVSTWGNSYSAAHIATNALSLFGYFQSTVIVAMEAVDKVPPIAASWAQNLAWSMGLIKVTFMQKIFRWYVQATGGDPATNIAQPTISVLVQKRDMVFEGIKQVHGRVRDFLEFYGHDSLSDYYKYGGAENSAMTLDKRADNTYAAHSTSTLLVIRGIKRVGYLTNIERTSIVLTGFTFFVLICIAMAIVFSLIKLGLELFARMRPVNRDRFSYFRQNWRSMLKGAILRMVYIGFPQLIILSFWEFTVKDSAAVIVLAVFFFLLSAGILAWNSFKVFIIGQRSIATYHTPAYLLYSDSQVINKYGFLYIQFEASKYYFIAVVLGYTFVKACFISFAQASGKTQGLAIFLIELIYLVVVCWKRPYMDRSTNVINIIICVIATLNAFFFLFFSNLFGQPGSVSSIMGVLFFIINAAFSLILLIFTLVTCILVLVSKHPDSRYKPAKDDRASFIQDQYQDGSEAAGEFTALGDAARADHENSNQAGLFEQQDPHRQASSRYSEKNPFSNNNSSTNVNSNNNNNNGLNRNAAANDDDDNDDAYNEKLPFANKDYNSSYQNFGNGNPYDGENESVGANSNSMLEGEPMFEKNHSRSDSDSGLRGGFEKAKQKWPFFGKKNNSSADY